MSARHVHNARNARSLAQLHPALRDDIGDLGTRRPLPGPGLDQIDPFLFLNHHGPQFYSPHNHGLPFGPHPHRGFETVTFILDGELAHLDSGGHESVIRAGGVQWMTAGSGLVHAEISPDEFKRDGGDLEILQLWVNLPSRLKMTKPRYIGVQRDAIPICQADDGRARIAVVSGAWQDTPGAIPSLTSVQMLVVDLDAGAKLTLPAPQAKSVFFYVVRGAINIGGSNIEHANLVRFNADGDVIDITTTHAATVLFGLADPIGEPVVSHGPFVMNTREEIHQAIRDYQAGKFGAGIDHIQP